MALEISHRIALSRHCWSSIFFFVLEFLFIFGLSTWVYKAGECTSVFHEGSDVDIKFQKTFAFIDWLASLILRPPTCILMCVAFYLFLSSSADITVAICQPLIPIYSFSEGGICVRKTGHSFSLQAAYKLKNISTAISSLLVHRLAQTHFFFIYFYFLNLSQPFSL